jgi:hypothetical protein
MDPTNFPANVEGLTDVILGPCRPVPWSDARARSRFQSELARSCLQLYYMCVFGQKESFCDELARLVNEVILPNIANSDRLADDAACALCRLAGLGTADGSAAGLGGFAHPRAPSVALAAYLNRTWAGPANRAARTAT